jgi:hypothetical protein
VLPGQNSGEAVASAVTAGTDGAPAWLASLASSAGAWAGHHGPLAVALLAVGQALIGAAALARRTRMLAVTLGLALTLDPWVLGQHLGGLYTGQATDPDTGPVLALMAIALLAGRGAAIEPSRSGRGTGLIPGRWRAPGSTAVAAYGRDPLQANTELTP